MLKLKKALKKVVAYTEYSVQITADHDLSEVGLQTPLIIGATQQDAISKAQAWLSEHAEKLLDAAFTRADLVLTKDGVLEGKFTHRLEEFLTLHEATAASKSSDDIAERVDGIWDGQKLTAEQLKFLVQLYKDHYSLADVDDDFFTSKRSRAQNDIAKRYGNYPLVKDSNLDFLRKLADGDTDVLGEILAPSQHAGFATEFAHEVWEKYFDFPGTTIELDEEELAEHGLTSEEDEVRYIAQTAVIDGIQDQLTLLASEWMQEAAKEQLSEEENSDD